MIQYEDFYNFLFIFKNYIFSYETYNLTKTDSFEISDYFLW